MVFNPGDIVIYDYNGFKYKLKLTSKHTKTTKVCWNARFISSLSEKAIYYSRGEMSKFPEEYMTLYNPTKLEKALL